MAYRATDATSSSLSTTRWWERLYASLTEAKEFGVLMSSLRWLAAATVTIIVAVIAALFIVWLMKDSLVAEHCRDGVPGSSCSHSEHNLVVEDSVAICRCEKDREDGGSDG